MTSATNAVATRLQPFGETVFAEFTRLAIEHDAINLGQGFPNFDGPEPVKEAAIEAIRAGHGQYPRSFGIRELNERLAARFEKTSGLRVDPTAEITVTCGCTEAIAATCIGLINPGDEIILLEPYYDSYRACLAMADAEARFVTLRPPDFRLEEAALRAAVTNRTRAILINTPHNPTGAVFSRAELESVRDVCIEHDLLAITDEVYENIVFDGEHVHPASLDGMWERTITLSSFGKTFSLTGWKIGWAIAPPHLTAGVRSAHQFLTFASATPLQHAAAAAFALPDSYYDDLVESYRRKRDLLVAGLNNVGFNVYTPAGTYFVLADHAPFGIGDDVTFCKHLIRAHGVAAIPPSAFYANPEEGRDLVRFAFCKDEGTLAAAIARLQGLADR